MPSPKLDTKQTLSGWHYQEDLMRTQDTKGDKDKSVNIIVPSPDAFSQRRPIVSGTVARRVLLGMAMMLAGLFIEELNTIRVEARQLLAGSRSKEMPEQRSTSYVSLRQHKLLVERRHEGVDAYEKNETAKIYDGAPPPPDPSPPPSLPMPSPAPPTRPSASPNAADKSKSNSGSGGKREIGDIYVIEQDAQLLTDVTRPDNDTPKEQTAGRARIPAWVKHADRVSVPMQGGKPCPAGCEKHGVCDHWAGQCHCPQDFTGYACDKPLMPACSLQGAAFNPFSWLGDWVNHDIVDIEAPRTITNVLVLGVGIPCECLRQAQNVQNLLTRAVEQKALYDLPSATKEQGKLGGILCVGDMPEGASWNELVERGGRGDESAGSGPYLTPTNFRVMPPDLMAPHLRNVNGGISDYERDNRTQVVDGEGIVLSDPSTLAKMLGFPTLNQTSGIGVHFGPAGACNDGKGCGQWGWCAVVVSSSGASNYNMQACNCYPGATQKHAGGECERIPPNRGTNRCAHSCSNNGGTCDGKGFCKCVAGSWGIDCGIRLGSDGFPRLQHSNAMARSPRIYVMDLPPLLYRGNGFMPELSQRLERYFLEGPHRVADPYLADYFYIPGQVYPEDHHRTKAKLWWARDQNPYWNATIKAALNSTSGAARHFIGWYSERGPGDGLGRISMDWLGTDSNCKRRDCQPNDLRASSPTRAWGHFTVNGNANEGGIGMCQACFIPGVDVVLPMPSNGGEAPHCHQVVDANVWQRSVARGKKLIDADVASVSAYEAQAGKFPYTPQVSDAAGSRRRWLGFWQGRAGVGPTWDGTDRGAMYSSFKCNHPRIRIINTNLEECVEQAKLDFAGQAVNGGLLSNSLAFTSAKFCMVPKGATGGDARRHMSAIAYGCVPVIVHDQLHMPYDELLDWNSFAVFVRKEDMGSLDNTLAELVDSGEYIKMQQRLAGIRAWMVWRDNVGLLNDCPQGEAFKGQSAFEVRWPKQTADGVLAAREVATRTRTPGGEAKSWPGPEEWGDGGATDRTGAIGGILAVLHNRLVLDGEVSESRRLPRQPY